MADAGVQERFEQAVQFKLNGQYDEAEALFKSVIAEQPTFADAYHELGLTYGFRAYMDESIAALLHAVQLNPASVPYMVSLGKTFAMNGDDDKAKMAFEFVLQMEPDNDEARKQMSYLM